MRICIFLLSLYAFPLFGQSGYRVTHAYSQSDGMSASGVYDIYADSRGFLWIATKEGLNRFDGFRFQNYMHSKYDSNSLAHNSVNDLLEYQPGMLLIATANGLSVLNTLAGKFENERISHIPLRPGNGANVTSMYQDADKQIWINQNGAFEILDPHLKYLRTLSDMEWARTLQGSVVHYEQWVEDSQGRIWLCTDTSGIQIIDLLNKSVINAKNNPDRLPFMQFRLIRSLMIDTARNALLIAPWGDGLYRYDLATLHETHQSFHQPLQELSSVNSIQRLPNGNLLCSSNGRFFETDPQTLAIHRIDFGLRSAGIEDTVGLQVITMLSSADHRFWVGTNQGLLQMEKGRFQSELSVAKSTGHEECTDITISSNGRYYALYDNQLLVEVDHGGRSYRSWKVPCPNDCRMTEIIDAGNEQLWIGTSEGIWTFDTGKEYFSKSIPAPDRLNTSFIYAMYRTRAGAIWIGTREPFGLFRFEPKAQELHRVEHTLLNDLGETGALARISGITEDHLGAVWLWSIAGGGLIRISANDTWNRFPPEGSSISLLENKGFFSLFPDTHGNVWLTTTLGDGLIRYDFIKGEVKQFNREDGMLSDFLYQVDGYGENLYVTTAYGFSVLNQEEEMSCTSWSGISPPFRSVVDTGRQTMVLGTRGKIVFLPLRPLTVASQVPVPVVDAVSVNHEIRYFTSGDARIQLSHFEKNISIDFTAPYYGEQGKLQFAYQLVGADQEWQFARENRTAQYAALSPGTYRFRIKASTREDQWSAPLDAFAFTITPPFWQRWWFIAVVLVVIAGIVTFLARRRMQTVRHEAGLKQKVAETEMMALRAQMNPHFIFNCINSIDALIMNDDKYQATIYLNKFAQLIRNILDSSKQNTVPIEKELNTLELYIDLERFRSKNAFTTKVEIESSILEKDVRVPPLIIQPYVENAILHGLKNRRDDKGELEILVKRTGEGLQYVVRDNGVGRAATLQKKNGNASYGMEMSSHRIMLFNQDEKNAVQVNDLYQDGKPAGTEVVVDLKLS